MFKSPTANPSLIGSFNMNNSTEPHRTAFKIAVLDALSNKFKRPVTVFKNFEKALVWAKTNDVTSPDAASNCLRELGVLK